MNIQQMSEEVIQLLGAKKYAVKRKANGYLKHDYLVPNGPYQEQWDWDGHFIGVALSRDIPSEAIYLKNWALNYFEHVQQDGFTPGLLKHVKPFLAQGASLAAWYLKDYSWIKANWKLLKKSLDFRLKTNLNKDYELACWYDSMESGADNNPAVLGFAHNTVIACDLNTYLHSELRAMAELAEALKHKKDFMFYKKEQEAIRKSIMKYLQQLFLLFILLAQYSLLQGQGSLSHFEKKVKKASFMIKIDIKQATKDGIYLNGYVVNIPYEKLTELNGKTVRISGKVTILKGNKQYTDGEIRQGRQEDTKLILKPKIRVINADSRI